MTARTQTWLGVHLALGLLLVSGSALADDSRLAEARLFHQALEFEKCLAVLAQPAPRGSTEVDRADGEVMAGVCHFELGQSALALERFRRALRANPRALLPPYSSPKIVEAFASVQAEVRADEPAHPPAAVDAPAPARPTAPPATETARPRHGMNGLALVLGGATVVSGAIGAFGYLRGRGLESDANIAFFESDAYALGERAKANMVIANIGIIGALAFAVATAAVVWLDGRR